MENSLLLIFDEIWPTTSVVLVTKFNFSLVTISFLTSLLN